MYDYPPFLFQMQSNFIACHIKDESIINLISIVSTCITNTSKPDVFT
jgi:hypothetical protein